MSQQVVYNQGGLTVTGARYGGDFRAIPGLALRHWFGVQEWDIDLTMNGHTFSTVSIESGRNASTSDSGTTKSGTAASQVDLLRVHTTAGIEPITLATFNHIDGTEDPDTQEPVYGDNLSVVLFHGRFGFNQDFGGWTQRVSVAATRSSTVWDSETEAYVLGGSSYSGTLDSTYHTQADPSDPDTVTSGNAQLGPVGGAHADITIEPTEIVSPAVAGEDLSLDYTLVIAPKIRFSAWLAS